jgi:hypothetical protein
MPEVKQFLRDHIAELNAAEGTNPEYAQYLQKYVDQLDYYYPDRIDINSSTSTAQMIRLYATQEIEPHIINPATREAFNNIVRDLNGYTEPREYLSMLENVIQRIEDSPDVYTQAAQDSIYALRNFRNLITPLINRTINPNQIEVGLTPSQVMQSVIQFKLDIVDPAQRIIMQTAFENNNILNMTPEQAILRLTQMSNDYRARQGEFNEGIRQVGQ